MLSLFRNLGSSLLNAGLKTIGARNSADALRTIGSRAIDWVAKKAGAFIDSAVNTNTEEPMEVE